MRQILPLILITILSGCMMHSVGSGPAASMKMMEGDSLEIATCISDDMNERNAIMTAGFWNKPRYTEPVNHYVKEIRSNAYEVHYTGTRIVLGDPVYYIRVSQADDIVFLEKFTGWNLWSDWPDESIEACT